MGATSRRRIDLFLGLALLLNLAFWLGSRHTFAQWAGVPPVPSEAGAVMMTLGDPELSFRSGALTLQHLGDGGGRTTSLKDYDYNKLGKWFRLLNALDPASEHVPLVAAYYFGAVRDRPESTRVLVDFLTEVGRNPAGEKWRWLAQAAFLARHRMNDLNRALEIAYILSKMQLTDGRQLPPWAREYPAFILKAAGEKESARKIAEQMLMTEKDLPPNEVNFLKSFLIDQLAVPREEVEALLRARGG